MATKSKTFTHTGAMETWTVPAHKPGTLKVTVVGGAGRSAGPLSSLASTGGLGGGIDGTLDVARGTTLHVIVGNGATDVNDRSSTHFGPDLGGQGGDGGSGIFSDGAPGGCASEVRLSSDIADRIIVAGGGGGGGGKRSPASGNDAGDGGEGSSSGDDGDNPPGSTEGGKGGTLIAAGAGGAGAVDAGDPGSGGVGGDGGSSSALRGGGGGGGGYFGGGGGGDSSGSWGGPGGGGSSWADTSVVSDIGGESASAGVVRFEWEPPPAIGWKVGFL